MTFRIGGQNQKGSSSFTESQIIADANGWKSLTVVVDSDVRNRYEIQFYKKDNTDDEIPYDIAHIKTYLPNTDKDDWTENKTS